MTRDKRKLEGALKKKGFRRLDGDHRFYVFYTSDGKKTIVRTKVSHSHSELGDPLLGLMAKQCKLEKKRFLELVDCSLSGEDYEADLVHREFI